MTIRIDSPKQDDSVGINKDRNGINGLIIAEEGVFKSGRGRFNLASLERIVQLGNAAERGIHKRAQHPNASDDGLGTGVGRETNYRLDQRPNGSHIVRADMLFSKAGMEMNPKGTTPWGPYLISELEENPAAFQNSIVLKHEEIEDELSSDEDLPPLWMPIELRASDFVNSGDATHGDSLSEDDMISFLREGSSRRAHVKLTEVLSTQLDRAFPDPDPKVIRPRLVGFIDRYLSNRIAEFQPPTMDDEMDKEIQAQLSATESQLSELATKVESLSEIGSKVDALAEQMTKEREARESQIGTQKRAEEIAALCQQAGVTNSAEYIGDASLSVDDVKNKLFKQLCEKSASSLGEGEGDTTESAWDKLSAEFAKSESLLSEAGWTLDTWRDYQATERGIAKPEANKE